MLPLLVLAQFCCTALWFAPNAILPEISDAYALTGAQLGGWLFAVQLGFITGTLTFALLNITDRFSPSGVFLVCALLGAVGNAALLWSGNSLATLLASRFWVGFVLAGIYPVGMKIAADYYERGLGASLGYLVGALVVGTALPFLLRGSFPGNAWRTVVWTISGMAAFGGLLVAVFIPDGPYRRPGLEVDPGAIRRVFRNRRFRAAAVGYFGHMWELYALWTFVPLLLQRYASAGTLPGSVAHLSFGVIAVGALGCVLAGWLSERFGARRVARIALAVSGGCCLLVPLTDGLPAGLFLLLLGIWGFAVVADSPLLSALVATHAPPRVKGTALTIVTCLGFAVTIVSIYLVERLWEATGSVGVFAVLALGPLVGFAMLRTVDHRGATHGPVR